MKVNIGPYTPHWTTQGAERAWFRLRYKKYDWEVEKEDRDWLDNAVISVCDFWNSTVCRPMNRLNNMRKRKIKVKIHHWDSWNANETLAYIILPVLKQLREDKHGAPWTDDVDVPEELRSTSAPPRENDWETDDNHFKRWDWILNEMIWAFEQDVSEDSDSQFYSGEHDHLWQPVDREGNPLGEPESFESRKKTKAEFYKMVEGPKHTFKIDYEGLKKHEERIKNGHILFGKYYGGLWS